MNVTTDKVITTIREHLIGDGFEFVLNIDKSHGSWMKDDKSGRELLDFYSCFASNPLGFNHPKMRTEDTIAQLIPSAVNNITNSDLFTIQKAEFVETFYAKAAPPEMKHMFLIAGGGLAVENALKTAFDWKRKLNRINGDTHGRGNKVMHLRQAFHGRTGYTMSLTNTDPVKTEYFPKFDWPRIDNPKIVFPDHGEYHEDLLKREAKALKQARYAILANDNDIAACIIEPIQGEGGDNHFRGEFLRNLQTLCNENDIMFIVDEIQTGMGITGKMWAYEHLGLKPDMLCFGKKSQICGFICTDKIDSVENNVFNTSSRINSTWGGNLIDMVRCKRYLEIIEEDKLILNAKRMGESLLDELHNLQNSYPKLLSNVRGRGLMCAFDLPNTEIRDKLRGKAYEEGMLILACGDHSIRFRPTLTITEEDIHKGIEILEMAIKDVSH
ncbi:MAG: L-lysine 6-transaminase [Candidatus Hatepunaea meridiana]|nr:L-lysine 6-transaminase [Candidatus Hatepunaea meridiana]